MGLTRNAYFMEIMPSHEKWFGWKSPVGLGIFLITASLALAIFLYTVINLVVTVSEFSHPQSQSQGLTSQELQQLEQSAPASTGTSAGTSGTSAQ